nr:hypothetical protein [uncultured Allomuricauda sp.]
MKDKRRIRKRLLIEGLISVLIAISPLLFYLYKYLPAGEQKIDILGIDFGPNGFEDVSVAFYFYFTKIVPLLLLIIWFATSRQWWYHAILIPISMYSFQLYGVIRYESGVDENEILYIIAVTMIVVPIVYFIRVKLVDKHVHGIDLEAMDTELQILKEKEELRKEREKLEQRHQTLSKKV